MCAVMRVLWLCVVSRVLDVVALAMEKKKAKTNQSEENLHFNK
jgi:hypothetical protein